MNKEKSKTIFKKIIYVLFVITLIVSSFFLLMYIRIKTENESYRTVLNAYPDKNKVEKELKLLLMCDDLVISKPNKNGEIIVYEVYLGSNIYEKRDYYKIGYRIEKNKNSFFEWKYYTMRYIGKF